MPCGKKCVKGEEAKHIDEVEKLHNDEDKKNVMVGSFGDKSALMLISTKIWF